MVESAPETGRKTYVLSRITTRVKSVLDVCKRGGIVTELDRDGAVFPRPLLCHLRAREDIAQEGDVRLKQGHTRIAQEEDEERKRPRAFHTLPVRLNGIYDKKKTIALTHF